MAYIVRWPSWIKHCLLGAFVALAISAISVFSFGRIPVYTTFKSVYQLHINDLGAPIAEQETARVAYQAYHQHATILWLLQPSEFFALSDDGMKVIQEDDLFGKLGTNP